VSQRGIAFLAVYTLFIGLFLVLLLYLMPRAWNQLRRLANEIPNLLTDWQTALMALPENYPEPVFRGSGPGVH
jgi:putative permease